VVGMEYSTVFDKCPYPVNWEEHDLYGDYFLFWRKLADTNSEKNRII
jgi:hypothetical protein